MVNVQHAYLVATDNVSLTNSIQINLNFVFGNDLLLSSIISGQTSLCVVSVSNCGHSKLLFICPL